ncbi:MAG: hypothetical protein ACJA1A_001524 [Saprospiraceae bacterium]
MLILFLTLGMIPPNTPHSIQFLPFGSRIQLIVILILFQITVSYSQDVFISGPDEVCFSGTYTFVLENADPTIIYEWEYLTFGFGFAPFNYFIENQTNNSIEIDIYSVGGTGIRSLQLCAYESGTFNDHTFCKPFLFFPTPQDMLIFPADICDMKDNQLPYDIRYIDRYVCLGDTIYIGVGHYENSHETILPTCVFPSSPSLKKPTNYSSLIGV